VSSLGNFIEFEKETREEAIEKDTLKLKRLMDILGIKESDLIEGSYSDLLIERNYK
jgi:adenylate cyclase class IV